MSLCKFKRVLVHSWLHNRIFIAYKKYKKNRRAGKGFSLRIKRSCNSFWQSLYNFRSPRIAARLIIFLTRADLNGNPFSILHNSRVLGIAEIVCLWPYKCIKRPAAFTKCPVNTSNLWSIRSHFARISAACEAFYGRRDKIISACLQSVPGPRRFQKFPVLKGFRWW